MATPRDFTTLMVKTDIRQKFVATKKKMESQLGISMTNSNALEIMCDQVLSDSTKMRLRIVPAEE